MLFFFFSVTLWEVHSLTQNVTFRGVNSHFRVLYILCYHTSPYFIHKYSCIILKLLNSFTVTFFFFYKYSFIVTSFIVTLERKQLTGKCCRWDKINQLGTYSIYFSWFNSSLIKILVFYIYYKVFYGVFWLIKLCSILL